MKGQDLILTLTDNGTALASTFIKSDDITSQCDLIEKASATQQSWKEYIAGRKEWSLNISYLVMKNSVTTQVQRLKNDVGKTLNVTVKERGGSSGILTGTAILQAAKVTATYGTLVQGSFTLKGTGALGPST